MGSQSENCSEHCSLNTPVYTHNIGTRIMTKSPAIYAEDVVDRRRFTNRGIDKWMENRWRENNMRVAAYTVVIFG